MSTPTFLVIDPVTSTMSGATHAILGGEDWGGTSTEKTIDRANDELPASGGQIRESGGAGLERPITMD
ncbi:MAG: hypothetical protein VX726_08590 [Planctomycetota bacterium]|nr:hypothetical protein [Planctomycetota bacterium]